MTLAPPDELGAALDMLGKAGKRVLIETATAPSWAATGLQAAGATLVREADPVPLPKACKNPVELDGIRAAHRRDGAAVTRFLAWLAREAPRAAACARSRCRDRLQALRQETGKLRDLSLRHHLRRRPQRRDRALPRHQGDRAHARAGLALSGRFRRAISRRHDRHHPHRGDRHADAGDERPLHPRAEGPYRAGHRALPGRHHRLAARRAGALRRCGRSGSTTTTAPATASAPISRCTRARSASPRSPNSVAAAARHDRLATSPATTRPAPTASASRTWWRSRKPRSRAPTASSSSSRR